MTLHLFSLLFFNFFRFLLPGFEWDYVTRDENGAGAYGGDGGDVFDVVVVASPVPGDRGYSGRLPRRLYGDSSHLSQ